VWEGTQTNADLPTNGKGIARESTPVLASVRGTRQPRSKRNQRIGNILDPLFSHFRGAVVPGRIPPSKAKEEQFASEEQGDHFSLSCDQMQSCRNTTGIQQGLRYNRDYIGGVSPSPLCKPELASGSASSRLQAASDLCISLREARKASPPL